MDTGAWLACTSPKSYSALRDGAHTFRVRAIDAAGNTDATEATRVFTVDTSAPQTQNGDGGSNPAPGGGGTGPTTQAPVVPEPMTMSVSVSKARLGRVLAEGLRVAGRCSEPCVLKARLSLDPRTAKRLKLKPLVAAGSGSASLKRITLRFNAKSRKALKRLRKVSFRLVVSASGLQSDAIAREAIKVTLMR